MKKLIFCCSALFCLTSLQAQLEWAPVGAKYYYETWWDGGTTGGIETTITEVFDSVVLGQNCRHFKMIEGSVGWTIPCPGYDISYEADGRVYFFDAQEQNFVLFYDFNKGPGEMWQVPFCSVDDFCERDTLTFRVDSISHVDLNGFQVKRQHFSVRYASNPEWYSGGVIYEGIGNIPHMHFWQKYCVIAEQGVLGLNCYYSPLIGTVNFAGGAPCVSTPTQEPEFETSQLLLSPNPVSDQLQISFASPPAGRVHLRIFDVQGRLMQDIQTEAADNPSIYLPVNDWPAGIYLLQALGNGKTWPLQRFVKL